MLAEPAVIPVTTPPVLTVAILVAALVHVPPDVPVAVKVVVAPGHTVNVPLITPDTGVGLTVTTLDFVVVPHPLETA